MTRILTLSLDGLIFMVIVEQIPADCYVRLRRAGEGFVSELVPGRQPRDRREAEYTATFNTKNPEELEWSNESRGG
jgi:hypothetical protein